MDENQIKYKPLEQEDSPLDLKKYFFGLIANWHWFVISIFVSLGVAIMVNRYTMPVYKVGSTLMISDNAGGLTGYENLIPGMEIYRTQKQVLNEMEVLKSYSIAQRTLDNLSFDITYIGVGRSGFKEAILYNSCPFIVIPDSGSTNLFNYPVYINILNKNQYELTIDDQFNVNQIMEFGEKYSSNVFNFTIILRNPEKFNPSGGYSKYYFKFMHPNALVNNYRGRLYVAPNDQRRGSVIYLSLSGNNPYQITDYLNKLMEVYIQKGLEEKNQTAINTVEFIDEQLTILDTSLRAAELELQDFLLENKLVDVKTEGSLVHSRLEKLEADKAQIDLQNRYFEYLKKYVSDKNNLNQLVVPSIVNVSDQILNGLISSINELYAQKSELLFTVNQENPKVTLLESNLSKTRDALLENISTLIENNNLARKSLEIQLLKAEQALQKYPVTERLFVGIQRKYKVNDQIYTYLLQKRAESAVAKASNVADNKILDFARVENASLVSPKKRTNTILGLVMGILLPLSILILLDIIVNKVTSRMDIERKTTIPVISSVGHSDEQNDIPVFSKPNSSLAESFRGLRTNLQFQLRESNSKVINVTSTISGEGKTFCSTNLACIFAMAGKKTLLIGLDLRKPKVNKIFNVENTVGLSTCLIGKTKLEDIIRETKIENLYLAPSGPIPPNPAELLESPALDEIVMKARELFDLVILDTPPFGMVTDARLIARTADLNLFILRQNYSTMNILELLEDVYRKKEIGPMGIVLNDMKHRGYYGYGYRYYNYGYKYGYGYYYTYGKYSEDQVKK